MSYEILLPVISPVLPAAVLVIRPPRSQADERIQRIYGLPGPRLNPDILIEKILRCVGECPPKKVVYDLGNSFSKCLAFILVDMLQLFGPLAIPPM